MSLIQPGSEQLRCIQGHADLVAALVITPDSEQIVSASWDRTIKVWDLASGELLRIFKGTTSTVCALAMTPDGQQVVSGNGDGTVEVWERSSGRLLSRLEGYTGVSAVTVTTDGQQVVSGNGDGTVKVWDLSSGKMLHSFGKHDGWISTLATTPNGQRIISGSYRTIRVWDLLGKHLYSIEHGDQVYSVAVTPDGQQIISGGGELGGLAEEALYPGPHAVKVWDLSSGRLLRVFKEENYREESVEAVAVTPDGRQVVSAYTFNVVDWDLKTGNGRLLFRNDQVMYCLALSLDSRWVGVGDHCGRIWVFALMK